MVWIVLSFVCMYICISGVDGLYVNLFIWYGWCCLWFLCISLYLVWMVLPLVCMYICISGVDGRFCTSGVDGVVFGLYVYLYIWCGWSVCISVYLVWMGCMYICISGVEGVVFGL